LFRTKSTFFTFPNAEKISFKCSSFTFLVNPETYNVVDCEGDLLLFRGERSDLLFFEGERLDVDEAEVADFLDGEERLLFLPRDRLGDLLPLALRLRDRLGLLLRLPLLLLFLRLPADGDLEAEEEREREDEPDWEEERDADRDRELEPLFFSSIVVGVAVVTDVEVGVEVVVDDVDVGVVVVGVSSFVLLLRISKF